MKLLFDQNLPPRLVDRLADLYLNSAHVSTLGLGEAQDEEVWEYARTQGYTIVSKDSDFSEISLLRGFPPDVIWIRRGNCSTTEIEALLRQQYPSIQVLEHSKDTGVVLLY